MDEIVNLKRDGIISENIAALIFDCDGTLVDSMPLHMNAWQDAFKKLGAVYNEEFLRSLSGMKEIDVIDSYNRTYGTNLDCVLMVKYKHEFFRKHIADIKPIKPVVTIARNYYGKKPLAVVSGSTRDHVHTQLKVIRLFNVFDVILTADDPFKPKPAPDLFYEAARRMHVNASGCMVFEDGDSGFKAAQAAGMRVVNVKDLVTQVSN